MLKLADLASRSDFTVGPLHVSPSRRMVEGPSGSAHVEPIVMKVFLLLIDAGGNVVTRDELFETAWGGVFVGDDSLNRAIARVRKIASETAPGLFEIETIPRTGYRLRGEILACGSKAAPEAPERQDSRISRRAMIAAAAALGFAGAGGFAFWFVRAREEKEFRQLMDRGEQSVDYGDPSDNSGQFFQRAIAMRPDDARAQGLFAFTRALSAEFGKPDRAANAVRDAEQAARAAFAVEPNEPNAQVAVTLLERSTLDFATTEDRLRQILAGFPENQIAMRQLWGLLQCVGRSREALALVDRALVLKPFAAANHYPKAQLLWILGRIGEADRVIDRAMQYWPSHRFVRNARFTIFAHTGRVRAALAMLEKPETTPQNFSPAVVALWRVSLAALDQRSPAGIAAARKAVLEAANDDLGLAVHAIMALSALGDVDGAFEVTDALFAVRRSSALHAKNIAHRPPVKSTAWRFAPWLFTPPTAVLRADARFQSICDQIGLTEYWAKREIKPDYQLGIA